ncbi:phage tail terminator protein, partial [Escherichia coli]|uniref:phage tail terminator protein n=1 Tax=Escherichia coli TaxID=562 RepID=UPI002FBD9DAB
DAGTLLWLGKETTFTGPDSELDMWLESTIFPALNDIPALSGLIDTLIPLGFNYQRDNEMATWAMAEITYQITYTN